MYKTYYTFEGKIYEYNQNKGGDSARIVKKIPEGQTATEIIREKFTVITSIHLGMKKIAVSNPKCFVEALKNAVKVTDAKVFDANTDVIEIKGNAGTLQITRANTATLYIEKVALDSSEKDFEPFFIFAEDLKHFVSHINTSEPIILAQNEYAFAIQHKNGMVVLYKSRSSKKYDHITNVDLDKMIRCEINEKAVEILNQIDKLPKNKEQNMTDILIIEGVTEPQSKLRFAVISIKTNYNYKNIKTLKVTSSVRFIAEVESTVSKGFYIPLNSQMASQMPFEGDMYIGQLNGVDMLYTINEKQMKVQAAMAWTNVTGAKIMDLLSYLLETGQ